MSWWERDHVETPEPDLDQHYAKALNDALATLTTKQRFVIDLRLGFRDGTSYTLQEIADLMGVSTRAVQLVQQNAYRRLRTHLQRPS